MNMEIITDLCKEFSLFNPMMEAWEKKGKNSNVKCKNEFLHNIESQLHGHEEESPSVQHL